LKDFSPIQYASPARKNTNNTQNQQNINKGTIPKPSHLPFDSTMIMDEDLTD
jgi:hypothetical protein